jgi:GNAT superfamily N-acetyltransferase
LLIELEIADEARIIDEAIRARFLTTRSSEGHYTKHFVAKVDSSEVGFLAVDPIPGNDYFIIYTLFVLESRRKQGIGSRILEMAEQMGKSYGYENVLLSPRPLEAAIPKKQLMAWYRKKGYDFAPEPNPAEDFVKSLQN